MLGWNIAVYRQANWGAKPASTDSPLGTRLVIWQTGFNGINWILKLVKEKKVIDLGGNGYPRSFTATTEEIIPQIKKGIPDERNPWMLEKNDIVLEGYEGQTVVNLTELAACSPNEWLLIEAWDES